MTPTREIGHWAWARTMQVLSTNHPNFGFTGIIWKYAFSAKETFSWRRLDVMKFRTWIDIYAGQMWLLIILLARHLQTYGELSINYCERRLKVFFFSDNHLAFLSQVQILHAFNYSDISLVASVARRRNRYPNLKVVQNKGSYTQKLIRGRIWGKYKFVLVPFLPFCPFALLPVCPIARLPICPFAPLPFCPYITQCFALKLCP